MKKYVILNDRFRRISIVILAYFSLLLSQKIMAATVLWDVSKAGNYGYVPNRWFADLDNHLSNYGFEIESSYDGFLNDNLNSYDIAVVCSGSATAGSYNQEEVVCIKDFVKSGGGLLVLSEYPPYYHNFVEPVANAFGVRGGVSNVGTSPAIYTSNFADHPLFDGINEISFQGAGELSVSSHLQEIVWEEGTEKTLGVAGQWGLGRVIVLGDINIFSTFNTSGFYYDRSDNREFSVNAFNYLVPEPASLALLGFGGLILRKHRA